MIPQTVTMTNCDIIKRQKTDFSIESLVKTKSDTRKIVPNSFIEPQQLVQFNHPYRFDTDIQRLNGYQTEIAKALRLPTVVVDQQPTSPASSSPPSSQTSASPPIDLELAESPPIQLTPIRPTPINPQPGIVPNRSHMVVNGNQMRPNDHINDPQHILAAQLQLANALTGNGPFIFPPPYLQMPPRTTYPMQPWITSRHGRIFPHGFGGEYLLYPFRRPKRVRTAFAPLQLLKLEHAFEGNQYVVGNERKALAKNLNLTETQVKVWFQNRRTKHKRSQQEDETANKSKSPNDHPSNMSEHESHLDDEDDSDTYIDMNESDEDQIDYN